MTARDELVRAVGEAILAEARKWPELPDRYGARIAPMGATGDDLGRAVLAVVEAAGWRPTTRCVNDTNGDGDCAACARNPDAPCRQPREQVQPTPGPGCYPPVDGWDGVSVLDDGKQQAAVDRAHAALGGPELTTDAELRALTPDQLEKCVHRALQARDVQAVEGYLLLMALKDPGRAQLLMDTLKVGVNLAKEHRP